MAPKEPTLGSLADSEDPFSDLESIVERLAKITSESRHLEWKSVGLFGSNSSPKSQFRAAKSAISFANTEGGFIVFGVENDGAWIGLADEDVRQSDPAKVEQFINGLVYPQIPNINYAVSRREAKQFIFIHVPPSDFAPHVTTKQIIDKHISGKSNVIIVKHGVYCRTGAKSELATPQQHHRLIERRTNALKEELLRRIREVPVAALVTGTSSKGTGTTLRIARVSDDPSALPVKLTRDRSEAAGVYVHEELSDRLFDEVNNVLDANQLLFKDRTHFAYEEQVYYRIYAERANVSLSPRNLRLLIHASLRQFYAPCIFWLNAAAPEVVAEVLHEASRDLKHPMVHNVMRVAVILGGDVTDWFTMLLKHKFERDTQKPTFYWTFMKMLDHVSREDRRLSALRVSSRATFGASDTGPSYKELLANPTKCDSLLTKVCLGVSQGDKAYKQQARSLDVIAYGDRLNQRGKQVWKSLKAAIEKAASKGS